MEQQYDIARENNKKYIGETLDVVMESYDGYADCFYGRAYMDAPDIDAQIIFTSEYAISEGEIVPIQIFAVAETGYDLYGKAV